MLGIEGFDVRVEVDVYDASEGGSMTIVGLPDAAVRESTRRVCTALSNSQFYRTGEMVAIVNLAPADVRKQGPGFDLAIALGLEIAIQQNLEVPRPLKRKVPTGLEEWCFVGELALDGQVRGVRGVLPLAVAARDAGSFGTVSHDPHIHRRASRRLRQRKGAGQGTGLYRAGRQGDGATDVRRWNGRGRNGRGLFREAGF